MRRTDELLAAWRQAERIVVVCYGNVCRSPFATGYLQHRRPDLTVDGAGYYPSEGRTTPENAVTAAAEFGVDLSGHTSRILTEAMMEQADLVLVFDEKNYGIVCQNHLLQADKVFPLGLVESETDWIVSDPDVSAAVAGYRATYQRIAGLIDQLLEQRD